MATRKVTVVVSRRQVGTYEARSYPHDSRRDVNFIELYAVPLYDITVSGTDAAGNAKTAHFQAPRFMPYWNDPKNPDPHYATKGWVDSGLSRQRTVTVGEYKSDYAVQNRYSPGKGAVVVSGSFYIHAGPATVGDVGFGSAGCIEIVGNYDDFKATIASLSGTSTKSPDAAIQELIKDHNLVVIVESASVPDIKSKLTRTVPRKELFP